MAEKSIDQNAVSQSPLFSRLKRRDLDAVWCHRRSIAYLTLAAAGLTLIVSFFLPRSYTATALLLPEAEESRLSALTQFADIAQLTGVMSGSGDVSRLYPTILASESVLLEVIHRPYETQKFDGPVNLITYLEIEEDTEGEEVDAAIELLRDLIKTSYESKTGVVSISIELPEPQLAADVLNAMITELDRFMREKRVTGATEQLRWINSRLGEIETELHVAEDSLRTFRDKNRRIIDSPTLLLQQQRLIRAVEISSTTFVELKKQHEIAKIEEIKNISLVNVLDAARPPTRHTRPQTFVNVVLVLFLGAISLSAYYLLTDRLAQHRVGSAKEQGS